MTIEAGDWAEKLVFEGSAEEVEAAFPNLDAGDSECLRLAIMTAIAIGDRLDLEKAFPDLAGANPKNWVWNVVGGSEWCKGNKLP